jgi:hypothetical protein
MDTTNSVHTIAELRQNFTLAKYGIDKILGSINLMTTAEDIDQCFEASREFLELVTIVKGAVDTSLGVTAATNVSPTLQPPPNTRRSCR